MEEIQETGELPAGAVTTSVISIAILGRSLKNVLGVLRRRSEPVLSLTKEQTKEI